MGGVRWRWWGSAAVCLVLAGTACGDAESFRPGTASAPEGGADSAGGAGGAVDISPGTTAGGMAGSGAGGSAGMAGTVETTGTAGTGGAPTTTTGGSGGAGGSTAPPPCQSDAECEDGVFCNGEEACVLGDCVAGSAPCDDGVECTADTCDEATATCAHAPEDGACDNGIACDGAEVCDAVLGCQSVGASCDDDVACTVDFCDPVSGLCTHQPDDTACANEVFCDGIEQCDPAVGDPASGCAAGQPVICADGIACTKDTCDEATKGCFHAADDPSCSDDVFCNGAELCAIGFGCVPGSPPSCADARSCTADACDEATKSCVHTPNDAACSDGLDCNGQETCSDAGPVPSGCLAGAPIPCGTDGIVCTLDACDETTKQCEHTPVNGACLAGQFCVPAAGGCTLAPPCNSNADCDDNNACNGTETCNVVCQPGVPVVCDDGAACTIDSCDPGTGACSFHASSAFCDDGFACNGVETCDPAAGAASSGCVAGAAITCDDGVACTQDACTEPTGACLFQPIHALCSDGQLCNGLELCDPVTGCQAAALPYVCPDDGILCTTEVCDAVANTCKAVADDALCLCGETCSPAAGGCGNFCQISTCQGKVYQCGDCLDNDGDCHVDSADTQCLGPCDNTEGSLFGGIPGQNNSPCMSDCYFDQDTGSGNDDCHWSHKCDPLEVGPSFPPEGSQCAYNPNANIPGFGGTCDDAFTTQSTTCADYCGPLTPNGCDCFGCCAIPGAPTTVWLGSEQPAGTGSCTLANINDPTKCKPCTQVQACLNTCAYCEVCIGKPDLPPDCNGTQECGPDILPCGEPGQAPCSGGFTCITGCCQPNPT